MCRPWPRWCSGSTTPKSSAPRRPDEDVAAMYISGVGAFVPETVGVDQAVAAGWYPAEEVELHDLAGAAVAGDVPAPELALRAARSAVARSGRAPADFDLLLYAS